MSILRRWAATFFVLLTVGCGAAQATPPPAPPATPTATAAADQPTAVTPPASRTAAAITSPTAPPTATVSPPARPSATAMTPATAARTTATAAPATRTPATPPLATRTPQRYAAPPPLTIDPNRAYIATIKTNLGDITIELYPKEAPATVNNFVFLARAGFYDGTIFHRVIKGFVIQGGDPTGTGTGGPGYRFPDEPVRGNYEIGSLAMANSGPNTNGSQFFICEGQQCLGLPKQYNLFGKVSAGLDVVRAIAALPTDARDRPLREARIATIEIVER